MESKYHQDISQRLLEYQVLRRQFSVCFSTLLFFLNCRLVIVYVGHLCLFYDNVCGACFPFRT